ncbi:MAG: hypothetical protein HZB26_21035 [Candidatus Hydrogenedentes bacterium]|nr:hypothetical protein [Candidatus Hydrogenedentota bacterium]
MARKAQSIQVLQIDDRAISCLRALPSSSGVAVAEFLQERGSWSQEDGSLQRALADFASRHNLAGKPLYTVLPRHEMTVRILALPSHDTSEIANMVRFSAEEFVPYALEDLVIDQCIVAPLPDGHSRVLTVLAHKDIIDAHLSLLRGAGLEPDDVLLSTACIATAAAAAQIGATERCAIVSLAASGWEVLALNGIRLDYTRGIASPQDWEQTGDTARAGLDELATEIRASLSAYRRESEDAHGAEALYFCSEWAPVASISEAIAHEVNLPCSPASFAKKLATQGKELLTTLPLGLLGGALVAQGRSPIAISLLPKSVGEARSNAAARRRAVSAGVLAAIVAVGLGLLYAQAVFQRKAYLAQLETRIAQIRDVASGVSAKQKQLKLVQSHLDRSGGVLDLLATFSDLAPPMGMNISRVVYKRGDNFTVEGRSETKESVNQLADELRKSGVPNLEQTISGTLKSVEERGRAVWQYELISKFPASETVEEESPEDTAQ